MKLCPQCRNSYPSHYQSCPQDNTPLQWSATLEAGAIVRGKYEVLAHLGSGGMADVYKVRNVNFDEVYALKLVKAVHAEDRTFCERFRSEAVLTRRLRHPNAIAVEDYDVTEDGRPYIVMEYVKGRSLLEALAMEGALDVRRALELTRQAASALGAAHQLGIVHRDVKPANMLLSRDADGAEQLKLADFGVARMRQDLNNRPDQPAATATGTLLGTPQYMSPEQAQGMVGEKIDGRSDIYSLGMALYQMLTGRLPFHCETPMAYILAQTTMLPTPPRDFAPERHIPETVNRLVMRALEKDREQRFANMQEMVGVIDASLRLLAGGALSTPLATPAPTRVASTVSAPATIDAPSKSIAARAPNNIAQPIRIAAKPIAPPRAVVDEPPAVATIYHVEPRWRSFFTRRTLLVVLLILACAVGYDYWRQARIRESLSVQPTPYVGDESEATSAQTSAGARANTGRAEKKNSVGKDAKADMTEEMRSTKDGAESAQMVSVELAAGQRFLANHRYLLAITKFRAVLAREPNNAEAKAGLQQAQEALAAR